MIGYLVAIREGILFSDFLTYFRKSRCLRGIYEICCRVNRPDYGAYNVAQITCDFLAWYLIYQSIVIYYYYYFLWLCSPARAMASSSHEVS
jgi:hypothetical protein